MPSQNEDKIPKAMSRDKLAKALFESLKDISLEDFVRLLTNETEEIIQYYGLTRGYKGCQRMNLLFTPHRLSTKANALYQALQRRLKTNKYDEEGFPTKIVCGPIEFTSGGRKIKGE